MTISRRAAQRSPQHRRTKWPPPSDIHSEDGLARPRKREEVLPAEEQVETLRGERAALLNDDSALNRYASLPPVRSPPPFSAAWPSKLLPTKQSPLFPPSFASFASQSSSLPYSVSPSFALSNRSDRQTIPIERKKEIKNSGRTDGRTDGRTNCLTLRK